MPIYAKKIISSQVPVANVGPISAALAYKNITTDQDAPTLAQSVAGAWAWHYIVLRPLDSGNLGATAPAAPFQTSATAGTNSVTVTWNTPDDGGSAITHYDTRFRVPPSGAWVEEEVTTQANSKTWSLNPGSYEFQTRAVNAIGDSPWSNSLFATVGSPPSGDPSIRIWWNRPARTIYSPVGSGVNRNVTNASGLSSALAIANPGDCINLASGEYGRLQWRRVALGHKQGTAGNPITIQAQAGANPTFTGSTLSTGDAGIVEDVSYYRLSGLNFNGNAQFGLRLMATQHGHVTHCLVHDSGHANFVIQDWSQTGSLVTSNNITAEHNDIYRSGRLGPTTIPYGEGMYVGYGSGGWTHNCYNIFLQYNDIYEMVGDGVDLKPGVHDVYVRYNRIHDGDCPSGAAISHMNNRNDELDPTVGVEKKIYIYGNRIWNIGFGGNGSAYGIQCHLGGERIYNNILWSFSDEGVNTRGINCTGTAQASSFQVQVYNNTVWVDDSFVVGTSAPTVFWNNLTPDGLHGQNLVSSAVFSGTVPAVKGVQSTAGGNSTDKNEGINFRPLNATAVPATTSTVPSDDLTLIARPQGARSDAGALEFI